MQAETPSVRRGKRRQLAAVLRTILAAVSFAVAAPAPASAQFIEFMEWLDKLSGPGPFQSDPGWFPGIRIPVGCISEVTTLRDGNEAEVRAIITSSRQPDGRVAADPGRLREYVQAHPVTERFELEGMHRCLGLFGVTRSRNPLYAPWGSSGGEPVIKKRNVVAFEANLSHLASRDNELSGYRPDVPEEDRQVKVFVYGIGARYLPAEWVFVRAGWDRHRFYSPGGRLFESFTRDTRTLEFGVKPPGKPSVLSPLTFSVGVRHGMGTFVSQDFGAIGTFRDDDNQLFFWKIGYDIWWSGCWLNLCDMR